MKNDDTYIFSGAHYIEVIVSINFSHLLLMLENTNDAQHEQTCKDSHPLNISKSMWVYIRRYIKVYLPGSVKEAFKF